MDEKLEAIKDLLRQFRDEVIKGRDAEAVLDRYARAIEGVHRYYEGAGWRK